MPGHTFFDFEWDPRKARTNLRKHGIAFRLATTIFRDPLALTILDDEHNEREDRWVSLGVAENAQYLVVIHTAEWLDSDQIKVRIIWVWFSYWPTPVDLISFIINNKYLRSSCAFLIPCCRKLTPAKFRRCIIVCRDYRSFVYQERLETSSMETTPDHLGTEG